MILTERNPDSYKFAIDTQEPDETGDATYPRISLVIPALNEAQNLPHVLPRIPDCVSEVLLVDGHSTDGTSEVARQLRPDIRIIEQEGHGKGAALRSGFTNATGDIVVMLDADGSTDPGEIPLFVDALLGGADFAKGSRFMTGAGTSDMPMYRRLGNWGFVMMVRVLLGGRYSDMCYGYNAFWMRVLPSINLDADGFEIETKLNMQVLRRGFKIVEVPSFETPRLYGESHLKTFPDGLRVLRTILTEAYDHYRIRWRQFLHGPDSLPRNELKMPLQRHHGLYVIGGQQREPRTLLAEGQAWYDYKKGVILHVNTDTCEVEPVIEYSSLSTACAEGDPILFKSGTRAGNRVYTCTQTEIVTWALPSWEQIGYVSLPCFNDVHHVLPTPDGNLLVANSGLEMVLMITPDGHILREWNVLGQEPWEDFSKEIDYRQGVSTKPHRAHPNYVFYVGEDIWTTRFELKDTICLTCPGRRIPLSPERVHDGVTYQGKLYFTAVNGHVLVADPQTLQLEQQIDLNDMSDANALLGWCRGILLEEEHAWVGFSRIRPTKFREAVSWVRQGFQHSLPTRIVCFDLAQRKKLAEIDLEPYGLNAVFSILPA